MAANVGSPPPLGAEGLGEVGTLHPSARAQREERRANHVRIPQPSGRTGDKLSALARNEVAPEGQGAS